MNFRVVDNTTHRKFLQLYTRKTHFYYKVTIMLIENIMKGWIMLKTAFHIGIGIPKDNLTTNNFPENIQ